MDKFLVFLYNNVRMKNKTNQKIYIGLQVLLFLGIVFFSIAYFCKWDFHFLVINSSNNIINCSLYFLFSFLPYVLKKFDFEFTDFLVYYFFVAVGLHFLGGNALRLYHTKYYSFVIHLLNCFLIGIVVYGIIKNSSANQGKLYMFVMTLAGVALIGVMWELFEFFRDAFSTKNMQRTIAPNGNPFAGKRAVLDTMIDLLMDIVGGCLAGLIAGLKIKNKDIYSYFMLRRYKEKSGNQQVLQTTNEATINTLNNEKKDDLTNEQLKE